MLHDKISRLVKGIYQAPYDETLWQRMTEDLRSTLGCRAMLVSVVDAENQNFSTTSWVGPEDGRSMRGVEEYYDYFHHLDPTIAFAASKPSARFCDVRKLITPDSHLSDPYMSWYTDRFRSPHFAVCYTPPSDGLTFGLSMLADQQGSLNYDLFRMLFDHVASSVEIAARPPSLESESDAFLLVRASGTIAALTPLAERYCALRDGLSLANGVIEAAQPDESGCTQKRDIRGEQASDNGQRRRGRVREPPVTPPKLARLGKPAADKDWARSRLSSQSDGENRRSQPREVRQQRVIQLSSFYRAGATTR